MSILDTLLHRNSFSAIQLESVKEAVLEAARTAQVLREKDLRQHGKVTFTLKPDGSKQTAGDRESEALLRRKLPPLVQGSSFLGEEGNPGDDRAVKPKRWNVDPIDGTSNYAANQGRWAVSAGYQEHGITKAAVVFVATEGNGRNGLLYSALKDKGAFREEVKDGHAVAGTGRRLQFIDVKRFKQVPLRMGFFCDDSPNQKYDGRRHEGKVHDAVVAALDKPGYRPADVTCATADILSVTEDATGAYAHGVHFPWDTAAVALIMGEAGYPMSEYKSATDPDKTAFIAASNRYLFRKLDQAYRDASESRKPSANYQSQLDKGLSRFL